MTDSLTASLNSSPSSDPASFNPPAWLANPHLQSILPSLRIRRPLVMRRARQLLACSQEQIVDCGDGVRLLGHYSSQVSAGREPGRDLAILLHGWEGNADSMYVLSLGSHLFARGCDVFRLNFRDHGPTHHLNKEIFHSCRLDEVVGAVRAIQQQHIGQRLTLAGFSLGGNFALRIAARAPAAAIQLERAIGVCPVLRPHSTMDIFESAPFIYQQYFVNKWKSSLRIKQSLFPDLYDFGPIFTQRSIRTMTEVMVERYSEFASLDAYLNGYSIVDHVLAPLEIPSHILFALDDPIIPAADLKLLDRNPQLHVNAIPRGGHCGFMDRFSGESWADRQIASLMGLG
ncbi:YheT family hydrolase [Povalibacter sp.]|uniref:YheT family hydrolase n=1 Tax=Povalibacter sp. TaxID=1962978 RepID=UPI002F3E98FF